MTPGKWYRPKDRYKVPDRSAPGYYILPSETVCKFKRWDRHEAVMQYWYGNTSYLYSVFVPVSRFSEWQEIERPGRAKYPANIWAMFEADGGDTAETETGQIKFEL